VPIYEFYCESCNTVFSFFTPRIDTAAAPACPRCGRPELPRKPSRFAGISKRTPGEGGGAGGDDFDADDPLAGLDDDRMAGAMESLAAEMEGMDESAEKDPKQMVRFLERFQQATGLEAGPKMEEMMARLAEGADVDELEEKMGGGEGGEDPYGEGPPGAADDDFSDFFRRKKEPAASRRRPRVDDTLYFL
jgi:putative FmdB family regulatory protein